MTDLRAQFVGGPRDGDVRDLDVATRFIEFPTVARHTVQRYERVGDSRFYEYRGETLPFGFSPAE